MKEALHQLLDHHLPIDGLAAWSVRLPDRTLTSQCFADWFTPAQVEQVLARLALAEDSLAHHGIKAVRSCWKFEHARVYLVLRPDGACLALFAENRPGLPAAPFEAALEAFARLA